MTWTPTPQDQIPDPEVVLAGLDRGPGEPEQGYITPDDLRLAWQTFLSENAHIATEFGDPALLTTVHPAPDLVHWLAWLEGRIAALEAGTPPVTIEGSLEVDDYSNGFIRVRDVGGLLSDGQVHAVNMILATTPGPGGVVITDPPGIPASPNPTWFDVGGTLGYVKGATGTNVNQTTMRNWVKYGDPGSASHYVLFVRKTIDPNDASKPLLVVEQVVNVA